MIINHNMSAINANRQMATNQASTAKSTEKLSSGLRINRAGDDAAGLAISEKMRAQVSGLNQASRNAQDGISLIQTAEGTLNESHSILQRMRELAVQSGNDTNTDSDRSELQKEVDQLASELTRITTDTEFNTKTLLDGSLDNAKFQIGANSDQNLSLSINAMDAFTLGVASDKTTISGKGAGNIADVTFDKTQGAGIADKAEITFNYIVGAGTPTVATSGTLLGDAKFATNSGYSAGVGDSVKITIDDTVVEIKDTNLADIIKGSIDNAVTKLGALLDGKATVEKDGDKLKITSATEGKASTVSITIGGAKESDIKTALGMTTPVKKAGTDAITGKDSIKISDNTSTQTIEIDDKTATSLKLDNGTFSGLTINLATDKTLADLKSAGDKVTVSKEVVNSTTKEVAAGIDISTHEAANTSIKAINTAIETVSAERSKLGSYQNRLEHTINNLGTSSENLTAAESRIRDVDMAEEMMEFTKNNVLSQASQAMLAQAKALPNQVLSLLQ